MRWSKIFCIATLSSIIYIKNGRGWFCAPTLTGTSTTMMMMTMTSNKLTAPTLSNGLCIHTLSCRRTNWSAHSSWRTERAAETSLDESTPLVGRFIHKEDKPAILDRVREIITRRFPKVNFAKLGQIGFSKKGDDAKIVSFGPKGGESDIFKKNDSGLLKSLTDRCKNTLGLKAEDITAEDNKSIREEKQLREKERIAADHQRANDEVQNLRNKIEQTRAKIDTFDEDHGSESELQRLKLLKK